MTCLNIKVKVPTTYIIKPPPPPIKAPSHVNAHPPLQDFPNLSALGVNPRGYGSIVVLVCCDFSLQVEPFAGILDSVRFYVPRVLFNRNVVGPFLKKRRANDVVSKGKMKEHNEMYDNVPHFTGSVFSSTSIYITLYNKYILL